MIRLLFASVSLLLFAADLISQATASAADRGRVVIVRPIVLCDDDGSHAAASRLQKQLVDQVYTKADLEFLYLPPRRWNYGAGRRGEVNLDTVVRRGLEAGMIVRDERVVTLLFVTAVDGREGPLGRGMQNGNICFVSLGPDPEADEPGMNAFVVAHEIGHCLDLRHAVDDPRVPDDVPNLQGDGPYRARLTVEALHEAQCTTILQSPLVNDRVHFSSAREAAERLTDETWEPYLSEATGDMLRFCLGMAAADAVPEEIGPRLEFARRRFAGFAAEFDAAEQEILTRQVRRIRERIGADWPLLARFPWNFVKASAGFCSDFPHTRGLSIVLSARAVRRIAHDPVWGATLLLHEKIHVLQRVLGDRFHSLYRGYGYQPIVLDGDLAARLNLAQNPDAWSGTWAFPVGGAPHLLATAITTRDGRLSFEETLLPLRALAAGTFAVGDPIEVTRAASWKARFAIRTGYDHPNEVAAYLGGHLLQTDYLKLEREVPPEARASVDLTREFLASLFALPAENG